MVRCRCGFAAIPPYSTPCHSGSARCESSLNWVYRFVDRAFYVGQANKRYFLWCGLKEDQLTYAPHAVDNEFFMKDDEQRQEALQIRKDLGIDPEATVFLFAGKLEAKKQPIELAEAFASLSPKPI